MAAVMSHKLPDRHL